MNIVEFVIGFVFVVAAFYVGIIVGARKATDKVLNIVKSAMDETLGVYERIEFLNAIERISKKN